MSKPQWQIEAELKRLRLKDLLSSTDSYAGRDKSSGLYNLWSEIGRLGQEIADLYRDNLP